MTDFNKDLPRPDTAFGAGGVRGRDAAAKDIAKEVTLIKTKRKNDRALRALAKGGNADAILALKRALDGGMDVGSTAIPNQKDIIRQAEANYREKAPARWALAKENEGKTGGTAEDAFGNLPEGAKGNVWVDVGGNGGGAANAPQNAVGAGAGAPGDVVPQNAQEGAAGATGGQEQAPVNDMEQEAAAKSRESALAGRQGSAAQDKAKSDMAREFIDGANITGEETLEELTNKKREMRNNLPPELSKFGDGMDKAIDQRVEEAQAAQKKKDNPIKDRLNELIDNEKITGKETPEELAAKRESLIEGNGLFYDDGKYDASLLKEFDKRQSAAKVEYEKSEKDKQDEADGESKNKAEFDERLKKRYIAKYGEEEGEKEWYWMQKRRDIPASKLIDQFEQGQKEAKVEQDRKDVEYKSRREETAALLKRADAASANADKNQEVYKEYLKDKPTKDLESRSKQINEEIAQHDYNVRAAEEDKLLAPDKARKAAEEAAIAKETSTLRGSLWHDIKKQSSNVLGTIGRGYGDTATSINRQSDYAIQDAANKINEIGGLSSSGIIGLVADNTGGKTGEFLRKQAAEVDKKILIDLRNFDDRTQITKEYQSKHSPWTLARSRSTEKKEKARMKEQEYLNSPENYPRRAEYERMKKAKADKQIDDTTSSYSKNSEPRLMG